MTIPSFPHIEYIVQSVERLIHSRRDQGTLDPDEVLAIDIVMHAIKFAELPDGLALWREALWQRRLADRARAAVVQMLEHLMAAAARGELSAINEICNCLQAVVDPNVFSHARANVASTGGPLGVTG